MTEGFFLFFFFFPSFFFFFQTLILVLNGIKPLPQFIPSISRELVPKRNAISFRVHHYTKTIAINPTLLYTQKQYTASQKKEKEKAAFLFSFPPFLGLLGQTISQFLKQNIKKLEQHEKQREVPFFRESAWIQAPARPLKLEIQEQSNEERKQEGNKPIPLRATAEPSRAFLSERYLQGNQEQQNRGNFKKKTGTLETTDISHPLPTARQESNVLPSDLSDREMSLVERIAGVVKNGRSLPSIPSNPSKALHPAVVPLLRVPFFLSPPVPRDTCRVGLSGRLGPSDI